ncbi:hypothetical protein KIW84_010446 [Lathyrus oleraceus]|uniref:Uncharacterized protein n=1 Tax=Pisum sativum TaxID=3888 RepID=A0A9D4YK27_PEA|nr:hypothetical protein KIW84_010446 [Pisum sativum]
MRSLVNLSIVITSRVRFVFLVESNVHPLTSLPSLSSGCFRSFIHLTTYNPVMDNLPCEFIIYVLTAIDNISHALFGQSFDCYHQQSKIRIPCGIGCSSFNKSAFALFRMFSVVIHLTTYNPVMDNLPCEVIIYVLTAIDNISHALFGQSFDCYHQQRCFRSIIYLTTYNPVMDNLPCEVIIYVLTAIDNISHALFGQSFDCYHQQSKIRIPCGIGCSSFNKSAFALFRMFSVVIHLTTYNPVMDNLPCEIIIYVLTAIDNMSHALLGRSRPPQSSKIRISCEIECPSFNKTAFLALFRMLSALEHQPIHALALKPIFRYPDRRSFRRSGRCTYGAQAMVIPVLPFILLVQISAVLLYSIPVYPESLTATAIIRSGSQLIE